MTHFILLITILLVLLLPSTVGAQESTAPAETTATADVLPAPPAETNLVVARVAGTPITEKQVLDAINEIAKQRNLPLNQMQERNAMLFNDVIDNLVTIAVIKAQVRERNITASDAEVEQQMKQLAAGFPSAEEFQKALATQGLTEADLRGSIKETIAMQKVIDSATRDIPPVTDADMEKFYTDNPDKFAVGERVRAAHILLQIPQDATDAQEAELKKELERIRFEIEAETISFADAAAKYSQDENTAANGGTLGILARGSLPKSFEDVIFNMKPETITPVLESQAGYHILKLLELQPAGKISLEEAKPAVKQFLEQTTKQTAGQEFITTLKASATIEAFMTAEEFAKRHP